MIDRKIMKLLRSKTGKDIHGIYRLISNERKRRGFTVRKETAAYLIAGELGIDIARYLSDEDLAKVTAARDISKPRVELERIQPRKKQRKKKNYHRVYNRGQSYDFYLDLQSIIKSAKKEVWIVDGYLDDEIFNLYVEKLKPHVKIKILTKDPKSNFLAAAQKFKIRPSYSLEVRGNPLVHDRFFLIDGSCWVSGQSVKDAGKKPTYLVKIESKQIEAIINEMWNNGNQII